jgi:hypothetical protein
MKEGLKQFLAQGIRFFTGSLAANYVGLRSLADPASSFYINLLTTLPAGLSTLTIDASGNMGTTVIGGVGTVTTMSTGNLSPLFTAAVSNPTSTPALAFTLSTQAVNTVFAGGASGGSAAPTFRALVAADIPQTLTASYITNFDAQVRTSRPDQMATVGANFNFGAFKGTNLADGTNYADIATWGQVQALFNGSDNKANVRLATTASLGLTSATATTITKTGGLPTTLDGGTLAPGDRIFVKDETGAGSTGAAANGLYLYTAGTTWTRATDADISAEVTSGLFVFVSEGTLNGSNGYTLLTADPIVLGTTQLNFQQTSGAGQIIAGAGLTKTGNQLDVVGALNRLLVNADNIDISPNYAGQTTITILGAIATGVWQGTAIAVANGGTGASTAATARANLSAPGIYSTTFTSASLASNLLSVTHNLGRQVVGYQLADNNNVGFTPDNITFTSTTQLSIDLTSYNSPSAIVGTYTLICWG